VSGLAYETVRRVTELAGVLLQRNPGPMTLDGTNTWLLRPPGSTASDPAVVVDPGQTDDLHLERLLAAAPEIALVLVTHGHPDHSQAAVAVHERTGAAVRAIDPKHCRGGAPLADEELIEAAGLLVRVLATPGHTADSASFVIGADADGVGAVLSGDTILGRGSTVVAHPSGVLGDYLDSLERLRDLGELAVLTGHGPELASVRAAAEFYLDHRRQRLAQVRDARERLGPAATARDIVEHVYADVDQVLWPAAERSVRAQLAYLDAEQPRG
jgi:glyoxylase-like metal-dependent hydrolase (beta-lactamase superfamily II)